MIQERACPRCDAIIYEVLPPPVGRPRRWCSTHCRRAASEERRAAANGAIAIEYIQVEMTLDDHVRAVLESPTACRRVIRDLRNRAEKGKLSDARWSSVEDELHRVRPARRPPLGWGTR